MTATNNRRILITGAAGFIGSTLADALLAAGDSVTGFDNFNNFYNPEIKRSNVKHQLTQKNYSLLEGDLRDSKQLDALFEQGPFDAVVHLAAMAGVRPSLDNPELYMDVNVLGTQKLVDRIVKKSPKAHLVFGSSSSVYGSRSGECFVETDRIDQPLSPYAASKAANEAQLYAVHHTVGLSVVCLRFFTVFGPRQRPDLAIHKFCKKIEQGDVIEVYGDGSSKRDYTYVQDIVSGIRSAMELKNAGFEIINLGRSEPVVLIDMIQSLEVALGKKAKLVHKPIQIGDVPYTFASIDKARSLLNYNPTTSLQSGVTSFVEWYRQQQSAPTQLRV